MLIDKIVAAAEAAAGVPLCHAPSPSAGEKVIYRCTPGRYDGEFETVTVTMRFISAESKTAFERAEKVALRLCHPGDYGGEDAKTLFTVRRSGGGSGYIGRTGHFCVTAMFEVRSRVSSPERRVEVVFE